MIYSQSQKKTKHLHSEKRLKSHILLCNWNSDNYEPKSLLQSPYNVENLVLAV